MAGERPSGRGGALEILLWLLCLVGGVLIVAWSYPRSFPLAPDWSVRRGEALQIAEERLRDLGKPLTAQRSAVHLSTDPRFELLLAKRGANRAGAAPWNRLTAAWRVTFWRQGESAEHWSYRARIALDGAVLDLERSIEDLLFENSRRGGAPQPSEDLLDEISPGASRQELTSELRRQRADRFLEQQGFQRVHLGEPFHLLAEAGGADRKVGSVLRYPTVEGASQPFRFAIDVLLFAGEPVGFVSSWRSNDAPSDSDRLQLAARLDGTRQVLALVAIPLLGLWWVDRRRQSVLELAADTSPRDGGWGRRLRSFGDLWRGHWNQSSVALASLRGVSAGAILIAGTLLFSLASKGLGAATVSSWMLGPVWSSAAWPGFALLLAIGAFSAVYLALGLILTPWLFDRFGPVLGGVLVALAAGIVLAPPIELVPFAAAYPISLLSAAVIVLLHYRYDLLTAWLAFLVSRVGLEAMPLIRSLDPGLELQGWLALLGASLPLWLSLRFLGADKPGRDDRTAAVLPPAAGVERVRTVAVRADFDSAAVLEERIGAVMLAQARVFGESAGSDFHATRELEAGRVALAIGEVAGYDDAALVGSIKAEWSALVGRLGITQSLDVLNRRVYEHSPSRCLVAFCTVVVDPVDRSFELACAGHPFPYRLGRGGEIEALESVSYPLGARSEIEVDIRRGRLEPGDRLFLATHGVVATRRPCGREPFGFARLEQSLRKVDGQGCATIRDQVLDDLEAFVAAARESRGEPVAGSQRDDDLTILVLELAD